MPHLDDAAIFAPNRDKILTFGQFSDKTCPVCSRGVSSESFVRRTSAGDRIPSSEDDSSRIPT